jgi:hypothetical protein
LNEGQKALGWTLGGRRSTPAGLATSIRSAEEKRRRRRNAISFEL